MESTRKGMMDDVERIINFIRKHMGELGFEEGADYDIGVFTYYDEWSWELTGLHAYIMLSEQGWKKMLEKGFDENSLPKSIRELASKVLPEDLLYKTIISVERKLDVGSQDTEGVPADVARDSDISDLVSKAREIKEMVKEIARRIDELGSEVVILETMLDDLNYERSKRAGEGK